MPLPFVAFLAIVTAAFVVSVARHERRVREAHGRRLTTRRKEVERLVHHGRPAEAAELLERIVAEMEQRLGPLAHELASPLFTLGIVSAQSGRAEYAEAILQRALILARRAPPGEPGTPPPARVLWGLGWVLASGERLKEARPYYERALAEAGDDDRAFVEDGLGAVSQAAGALEDAERWYRRALASLEARGPSAGRRDVGPRRASAYRVAALEPDGGDGRVLDLLLRVGALATLRGALDQAEDDYRRALAIEERAAGPRGPLLTRVLDPLARVLVAADRLTAAEVLARRALELSAPDAVARAQAEVLLGGVLSEAGDVEAAKALLAQARARIEELPDPPVASVCGALYGQGLCLLAAGETEEAEIVLARGADAASKAAGVVDGPLTPELRTLGMFLNALAYARCELGKLDEAERDCQRALRFSGCLPDASADEPGHANALDTCAEIRRRQGRLDEARGLVDRALRAAHGPGGREDALTGTLHGTLARVLRDEGRRDEAVAEQEKGLAIVERTRGRGWRWRKLRDDFARASPRRDR